MENNRQELLKDFNRLDFITRFYNLINQFKIIPTYYEKFNQLRQNDKLQKK